jgi:hypothetical protein
MNAVEIEEAVSELGNSALQCGPISRINFLRRLGTRTPPSNVFALRAIQMPSDVPNGVLQRNQYSLGDVRHRVRSMKR